MAVFAACFVIFMHRANLARIWKNEESRIDFSKFKRSKKKNNGESQDTAGTDGGEDGANE